MAEDSALCSVGTIYGTGLRSDLYIQGNVHFICVLCTRRIKKETEFFK
jgi:hypothetical protein